MNNYELEIRANKIASEIKEANGDLSSAYRQFELEKEEIEKYMPIEAIIPVSEGPSLGMALKTVQDGESFWSVYSQAIKKKLCHPDGKLQRLAKLGLSTSAGAIVTSIISTLALPPTALGIAVPIAAILVTTGLEAYCEWSQEEPDDS
jgi:hypothetical protein